MFDLTGKTALVTGSSRGIGRAVAVGLARCGADIYVNYVSGKASAEETAAEIAAAGRKCMLVPADLRAAGCADEIFARVGNGVDILVLNASIQHRRKWEEITTAEFREQIDCNLRASLLLMQRAVPYMRRKHFGRIVTIGSVQEARPHPDMLVYAASKAAQTEMVRSLAVQLAGDGITVNNIAPGVILTDRNTEALSDPDYAKSVVATIPAGFCGEAADCVGAVQMLCSDEGRYITGQSLYIDGGKGIA